MVDQLITTWVPPRPPGIYGIISSGGGAFVPTGQGIIAIIGTAETGPLGEVRQLGSAAAVELTYGPASADRTSATLANLARNASLGGAIGFVCVRVGTGGSPATLAVGTVGALNTAYPGVAGNTLTVTLQAVAGSSGAQKQLTVYRGTVVVQSTRFAAGGDEAGALAAATVGQPVVFTASSAGVVPDVGPQVAMAGGANPTVAAGGYSTALGLLTPYAWRAVVTDSENPAVHSSIVAFIDEEIRFGRFRFAAVGEPVSVPLNDRLAGPAALNSAVTRYVGNGFLMRNSDGTMSPQDGYLAAAFDGGLLSTIGPGDPMTWRRVPGAVEVVGAVDESTAIDAGMGYYSFRRTGTATGVRTGKGFSSLVDSSLAPIWAVDLHDGWKYFELPATAFGLLAEIGNSWGDALANADPRQRPPNTEIGRETLCALADRVANAYIAAGWLQSGNCIVDPAHPPTADTAWFVFQNLVVALRAERLVLSLPFARP